MPQSQEAVRWRPGGIACDRQPRISLNQTPQGCSFCCQQKGCIKSTQYALQYPVTEAGAIEALPMPEAYTRANSVLTESEFALFLSA